MLLRPRPIPARVPGRRQTENDVSQSASQTRPWPAVSLAEARAVLTAPGSRFEMEELRIRGVMTRVWKHAPPTLRDVFLSGAAHGGREVPGLRGGAGDLS